MKKEAYTKQESKFINKFVLDKLMIQGDKKGQVTIFVIIAILIVGGLIIFLTATDLGKQTLENFTQTGDFDVKNSIENCVSDSDVINEDINTILIQGGNLEPEFSYMFQGEDLSYLCYTNEDYETCINQEPLLVQHIGSEILSVVTPVVDACIRSVNNQLEDRNYDITSGTVTTDIDLRDGNILINIEYPLTTTKGDSVRRFDSFQVGIKSEAYSLVTLSTSIINFEARYGDSDPNTYMALYPRIRVEKLKQGDGTTVYKVSSRETEESFNFAVRSVTFPPGYGL